MLRSFLSAVLIASSIISFPSKTNAQPASGYRAKSKKTDLLVKAKMSEHRIPVRRWRSFETEESFT